MKWQEELRRKGDIAYATGQELKFVVIRRQDSIKWKIYLKKIMAQGVDEIEEED